MTRYRSVAVAVDKAKYSLQALHWAVDNFLSRGQTLRLVHVIHKPIAPLPDDSNVGDQQLDYQNMDLFIPLRSLCARKQIQCETVVLEDSDVAKALIGYVHECEIDTLFLGAVSKKKGISRIFKGTDTPSTILKSAPDFCNVFIISKRKVAAARSATRPVPSRAQSLNNEEASDIEDDGDELFYDDEVVALDDMNSSSAGTNNVSLVYGSLGPTLRSPTVLDPMRRSSVGPRGMTSMAAFQLGPKHHSNPATLTGYSSSMLDSGESSEEESAAVSLFQEDNDETRRLKTELKQTMDMYHAACKEALTAKRQVMQLQEWKRKQEKRMRLEEQATSSASSSVDEATQKLVEKEVQKRVDAEIQKALSDAEARRRKLLDDLGQPQSQLAVKYQSLFHILAVIFLFYFYFTIYAIGGNKKETEYG